MEKQEDKLDMDEKIEKRINEKYDYSPTYLNELQGNLKAINDLIEEYLESSPSLPHEDRKAILAINFEADELKINLFEAGFYSENRKKIKRMQNRSWNYKEKYQWIRTKSTKIIHRLQKTH